MTKFEKPLDIVDYKDIAIERDVFLIQESDYRDFILLWRYYLEDADTKTPHPNNFIPIRRGSIEKIEENYLEVNLCVDQTERYHSSIVNLPKDNFVVSLENWNYQKQPIIIVKDKWMKTFMNKSFSIFCLIDAIGVKKHLIKNGNLPIKQIRLFKKFIDTLSNSFPELVFLSFGDSVIISSSFSGSSLYFYQYSPERILLAAAKVREAFQKYLEFDSYVVMSQGFIFDHGIFKKKRCSFGTHISFNSLGTPFTYLFDIDKNAQENFKNAIHPPMTFYVDERLWWALRLKDKCKDKYESSYSTFYSKISAKDVKYYWLDFNQLLNDLILTRNVNLVRRFRFRFAFYLKMEWDRFWHCRKIKRSFTKMDIKTTLTHYGLK